MSGAVGGPLTPRPPLLITKTYGNFSFARDQWHILPGCQREMPGSGLHLTGSVLGGLAATAAGAFLGSAAPAACGGFLPTLRCDRTDPGAIEEHSRGLPEVRNNPRHESIKNSLCQTYGDYCMGVDLAQGNMMADVESLALSLCRWREPR
jgi:hypothetical protein